MFRFKSFLCSIFISLLFVGLFCSSAVSTTLRIEDGQLKGAYNVIVNNYYYDVEFVDDRAPTSFTFTSSEDASAASQALLNYVLLDTTDYLFDSNPNLTFGIGNDTTTPTFSHILTPYEYEYDTDQTTAIKIWYRTAQNANYESGDTLTGAWTSLNYNFAADLTKVLAVWSEVGPVPEPNTILLLGTGLLSLAGLSRKNFNKA